MFDFDDWTNGQTVKPKPWMSECEFLLGTAENLDVCVDECIASRQFGLDLETSGLDNRVKLIDGVYQTLDKIAGVCISPDGVKGYYFPLKHKIVQKSGDFKPHPANIPLAVFSKGFQRLMEAVKNEKTIAIFHHGKFDQEFLEYNETGEPWGDWDNPKFWEDTMILGYLRNSRARNRRLKDMSAALPDAHAETQTGGPGLGMDMIEIYELFGHDKYERDFDYDFTTLDPTEQQCLWYAGSDAICTYRLKNLLEPSVLESDSDGRNQSTIYKFEKACVAATRWMERNRIHVDRDRTLELIQLGQKEWYDAVIKVYDETEKILGRNVMPGVYRALQTFFDPNDPQQLLEDQLERARKMARLDFPDPIANITNAKGDVRPAVYDINSPQQLGEMFDEMDVPGLKRTEKSGQIETSKSEIERIVEETGDQFPFMDSIRWFREINKALSTYLYPLYTQTDPEDNTARINFRQEGTDTGRFTTPSKSGVPMVGWPQINVQSIPKASESEKHPDCLNRVRECISCRPSETGKPPKYMVAIDFSGEELRLITNLSREPKWLKEFFHCAECDRMFDSGEGQETPMPPPARCPNCGSDKIGDIHTLTGLSVYGSDANSRSDWKDLRGKAKCVHPDTLMIHDGQLIKMGSSLPFGDVDTFLSLGGTTIGKDGETIPLLESYNGGIKPLFHVVTDRGVITCTDQHKFQTSDGSLCSIAGEYFDVLKPGVSLQEPPPIALSADKPFPTLLDHECNVHTAFFTGVMQGCNSIADKVLKTFKRLKANNVPIKEWPDDLLKLCQALNIPTGCDVYVGKDFPIYYFGRLLGIIGLYDGGIPTWVLDTGKKALIPYLAGLWAASGRRTLTTPRIRLASHVMAVLQALGIHATLKQNKNDWRITASVTYKTLLKCYLEGSLTIEQDTVAIKTPPTVKAIIPAGEGPCVDIHVGSPDHLYWCNGLTSHNSLNFALSYGGGGSAAQRATGVDKQEGWRLKNTFDRTYDILHRWWGYQHDFARKHGFVRTAFGRKYPVPDIRNPDGGFRAKAERNAVNGPVQGCLHSDCKIPTQDGIFTIKELWDRQENENHPDFQVWTGKSWSRARVSYSGIKPLVITTLTDGRQIKTSPDHLFRCHTENGLQWIRQENLERGSWVAVAVDAENFNHLNKSKALDYEYLQVTDIQDTGQYVPMYDLEVFDDDHAFVCDGIIVHNSGADICKIAMTLVYREMKNRGWLDKVMLIMTMHDELVFEIDADVLEEVLPTLVEIMTRNKAILGMKWPVPLTCDVEIGHDWTVPWHTTEMEHGEIRFIGNTKYKKPPEGYDWESMQKYPDELIPWLKEQTPVPQPALPSQRPSPIDSVAPEVPPGGEFVYQLKSPLTVGTLIKLADVISQCQNKGMATLKILTREGVTLEGWDKNIMVKISPTTFHVLAQHYGI